MNYTYDSANRVVKEVYDEDANIPFTIGYTYDEFGNFSKKGYRDADNPSYITTYSYDKNNRLIKENQVVSNGNAKWQNITSYGYDKNGNRLNRVEYKNKNVDSNKFNLGMIDVGSNSKGTGYKYSDYGKEVYTYDGLNELKSYIGKNEQNATYEYMPNHYRISKTVDGTKTYQLWDNDRVVSEFDSELNMKINYRIGTNGQVLSDSKENLYSYDGHGNLVNGKDNSSTTVYDAYGNKTEDIGIGDAPFSYCGEYTDSESGFVYLRNRYYDTSTGSFITEDPIKDGNNWYGYCAGNPVNAWDTSGLDWYIFYDPNFMENGEAQAIALSEKIQEQDPEKNVWRVEMSTEEDFKVRWNRMGTHENEGKIDGVIIVAHGNTNKFRTVSNPRENQSTDIITTSVFRADDIEIKKMDYFIFTSCKAGKSELDNLNYDRRGEENIAMGVSRSKQEIDCVIASSIEVIHRKNSSKIYLKEGTFKLYKWNSDYSKLIITSTNHNNINAILEEII